ncbi:hypothetical protein RJT34_07272 [Clitoria ternatea]|uniref:Uncharacterized protein n=1 Tax=Clitoria ternatea TaxID=43366 RepID=A0AAN9K5P7_CLITE
MMRTPGWKRYTKNADYEPTESFNSNNDNVQDQLQNYIQKLDVVGDEEYGSQDRQILIRPSWIWEDAWAGLVAELAKNEYKVVQEHNWCN